MHGERVPWASGQEMGIHIEWPFRYHQKGNEYGWRGIAARDQTVRNGGSGP